MLPKISIHVTLGKHLIQCTFLIPVKKIQMKNMEIKYINNHRLVANLHLLLQILPVHTQVHLDVLRLENPPNQHLLIVLRKIFRTFCKLSVFSLNSNVSPTTDIQYYHDKNHAFLKNEKQNLSQFTRADYGSTQERHSRDTSLKRTNASERRQKRKLVEKLRRKMERKALKHIVKKQAQNSSSESSIESLP